LQPACTIPGEILETTKDRKNETGIKKRFTDRFITLCVTGYLIHGIIIGNSKPSNEVIVKTSQTNFPSDSGKDSPIVPSHIEQALIADLKQGLPQAVEQWFKLFKSPVTAYIGSKIDNPKDRDELVQEVFVHSLQQLPLFRGHSSLWTWMCSIARHEVADYYRKRYAKKALKTLPLMDWLVIESAGDASDVAEIVRETLKKMTPKYRDLLLSKYFDEQSIKQLALANDRSEKAVESDLFRARREFKELWAVAIG